ncbi:hypothetical protein [Variovorax sp. KK3]|uniref:hypothetical protein n=1 Tax=Variovorax sp. KK3 TaxID=1855728 RepID=UPI00097C014A|nr:hypothetical protein [Variovorax sp. KK3]
MEIKLGEIGKIVGGQELGHYVKVVDDGPNTGGFLVVTSTDSDMQDGFDSWVEDMQTLQRFFEEAGWVIDWSSDLPHVPT